jgi:hypothetical protein
MDKISICTIGRFFELDLGLILNLKTHIHKPIKGGFQMVYAFRLYIKLT